jgi:hypothetical protein
METKFLNTMSLLALVTACNASSDSYTLYKTNNPTQGERIMVKSFSSEKSNELNGMACFKEKISLSEKAEGNTQYWCEKG